MGLVVVFAVGTALGIAAMRLWVVHRASERAAAWIVVANANALLRLDLEHLTGDDRNDGLKELREALKAFAVRRPVPERALLERYNALIGVAVAFGERVHDVHGNVDVRAVANRRDHLLSALAIGDVIEAALGGLAELASDMQPALEGRTVGKDVSDIAVVAARTHAQRRRIAVAR